MSAPSATSKWTALPDGVRWVSPPLFVFERSRDALAEAYGPPHLPDLDSNGLGYFDAWALRFECGLEVVLWAFHSPQMELVPTALPTAVEVHATEGDFAHIASHIGVDVSSVSPWIHGNEAQVWPKARWVVVRQDDGGFRVDVGAHTSRCEADLVAHRMEATGHKQTYWVEERDEER